MSEVDLSTLSGAELRGLLDSARNRGQAAQAYQILQELAERRAREDRKRSEKGRGRKASGPARVIALNLGDPLEPDDQADDVPASSPALAEAPPAPVDAPLTLEADFTRAPKERPPRRARPEPRRRAPEPPDERRANPKRRRWPAVGFAAGIALGVTVGFGIARETLSQPAGTATIFPAAPMLRSGEVTPAPPSAAPAPVDAAPVEAAPLDAAPAPEAAPPPATAVPPAPAAGAEVAQAAVPVAPEPVRQSAEPASPTPPAATEILAAETPAATRPCAGAATPADRAICADPALQRLQGELRRAYAEALEAHADRSLLRQRQLAWRDARNDVTDPAELARLYEARVRKLNAAAAEARREREGQ